MKRNKSYSSFYLLYLVSTPIGNLKEFNDRAVEIVKDADIVACEDTRETGKLLSLVGIKDKEFISLHEHNEKEASEKVVSLIKEGKKVVYMSDAGYPTMSDPGNILVKLCIENNIAVSCVNCANAAINALCCANVDNDKFLFYGFLEAKTSQKEKELEKLKGFPYTLVFYEAPHRIEETINSLYKVLGNRNVTLARELTKLNEEYIYGTLEELKDLDFETIKGEIVIIVEGNKEDKTLTDSEIEEILQDLIKSGCTKKDAIDKVASDYNLKKNLVYKIATKI
ncbi:MAG: 16S rRNA (cytidine(1402)-2'-O)-methyltransferase [Coprobacillus sp.]|nr:16S rRNA (cytidine(1402)-2'-O)-methyltransferase [Coprobacillus sp.]